MPQLAALQLPDGTQFITHASGNDRLVFEVLARHIVSISVQSGAIESYRDLLCTNVYRRSALDAGGANVRHAAIHEAGIAFGNHHEHFESARDSVQDGIAMLAYLVQKIGATECYQVARMAVQ